MPDIAWRTPSCTCTAASGSTPIIRCIVTSWPPKKPSSRWAVRPANCVGSAGNWRKPLPSLPGAGSFNPVIPTDPTVTKLLVPLAEIDDRVVYFEDSFTSWRDHVQQGAGIAATLRERLDPARPPHVGVLLENTPFFSAMLAAAGMSGIVPVGLNPVRRGEALARDIGRADCQLVLADSKSAVTLGDIEHLNVGSAERADELAANRDAEPRFQSASPADLFMLIFTSGTSGEPKAVKCSHSKVAIAGVAMTQRFDLGRDDVCYVSMPLFHSNAVLVGWAVAAACQGSMALRRKFSASNFLVDVRRSGATYAT